MVAISPCYTYYSWLERPPALHSGSIMIVALLVVWETLSICGFALIVLPALGTGIQASEGQTPIDFITALYYSGFSLTTLGTGDLVPKTAIYRLLTLLEAVLGFSSFTITITYLLSVYNALVARNTFALSLYHRTSGTGDTAELHDWELVANSVTFSKIFLI